MVLTETHLAILEKLKEGHTVAAHDKERHQNIYFDKEDQQFKYWVDEWDVGESTEILETPEKVFQAIEWARGWAHGNNEDMLENVLALMNATDLG